MSSFVARYEVPVDDQPHVIVLHADPIGVGCRSASTVEFWAIRSDSAAGRDRTFLVVGSGHPLRPNVVRHWGTAVAPGGMLVRHLVELAAPPAVPAHVTGWPIAGRDAERAHEGGRP